MPSSGLLALSGLGNLLGGIGQGAVAADTLGQHQRLLDLQQRAQELANPDASNLFRALGIEMPGGTGPVPASLAGHALPVLEARRVAAAQQASGRQAGGLIGQAAGGNPRLQALSSALGLNLSPTDRALIQDYLAPKAPTIVPQAATALDPITYQPIFTPGPKPTPGPTAFGYVQEPSINAQGQIVYGAPRAMNAMEHFNASQDISLPLADRQRHYDAANYGRVVPWTEGGGATGAANVATGGTGIPGYPRPTALPLPGTSQGLPGVLPPRQGQPTLMPGSLTGPPKPPVPEQQDKLASYDTAMTNIRKLEVMAQDPEVKQMLGSLGTNPQGAIARRMEEGVNVPLLGQFNLATLTPKQREFTGLMAATRTAALRSQEGLRPNVQFQQLLAPALSNLADPGIADKLRTLGDFMATNRASLQYELGQANRLAPSPPASAERPAQAQPIWNVRDTATGRVRRYQPAPGETQPPAGYELVR